MDAAVCELQHMYGLIYRMSKLTTSLHTNEVVYYLGYDSHLILSSTFHGFL